MQNMLSKKMIANIEILHAMSKEDAFKEYEEIYENAVSEDAQEDKIKLQLAYLTYAAMFGREPCEITKDEIYNHFQHLKITNISKEIARYKAQKAFDLLCSIEDSFATKNIAYILTNPSLEGLALQKILKCDSKN